MDGNAQFVKQAQVERTLKALAKNRIPAVFVPTCQEAVQAVKELLSPGDVVSCGGSMTLEECGVRDLLKSGEYEFLDRRPWTPRRLTAAPFPPTCS